MRLNKIGILDCGFGLKQKWYGGYMTGSCDIVMKEKNYITRLCNHDITNYIKLLVYLSFNFPVFFFSYLF